MQLLPPLVVTASLLPFLSEREKLAHVTHLCRSFPVLTTACFRHDHIVLLLQCVRERHLLYWQRYCQLVSSCSSPWIKGSRGWDDTARLLTFHSLRSLVVWTRDAAESFFTAWFSSSLSTSAPTFPCLAHLSVDSLPDVVVLRHLPALRVLAVRWYRLKRSEFRRLLALPLVELDLSECHYGQREEAPATPPVPVLCSTLRKLSLPAHVVVNGTQALLGPDVCWTS